MQMMMVKMKMKVFIYNDNDVDVDDDVVDDGDKNDEKDDEQIKIFSDLTRQQSLFNSHTHEHSITRAGGPR